MTANDFEKAIALELGMRDMEISRLRLQVAALEKQLASLTTKQETAVSDAKPRMVAA